MEYSFVDLKASLNSALLLAFPDFNQPFVVATDASSFTMGAVLAQKNPNGKVHPVQFASRTTKSAETNYSACERDDLAVIFALQKFIVYLLSSEPFVVVTDHKALKYAFQKKDIYG